MPQSTLRLEYERDLTSAEYHLLILGLDPASWEAKWYAYFEDDRIYFHRNWTGVCIYSAMVGQHEGRYRITNVLVNRDPSQYEGTSADIDMRTFKWLVEGFLFSRDTILE